MNPKVSILICTYNAGDYIKKTIQSVLDQSYTNIELLILDNCSVDKTIENIKKFDCKKIKVFESEKNIGPYGGLNFLLKRATGEYIAIQDHDDLWHPYKIEKQIRFLQKNSDLLGCGTTCKMFFEYDGSYFNYTFGQKSFYVIHPSIVFKNRPGLMYDEKELYMGDAFFQKHILCQGKKKLGSIDEVLTTHIIKGDYGNTSFSRFSLSKSCLSRLFDVHGVSLYACMILIFELMRKMFYPTLKQHKKYGIIVWLEQLPFRLMGFKIIK